jgi:hypothetical protein
LPLALQRAGVDPSRVHVLQIHLEQRQPQLPAAACSISDSAEAAAAQDPSLCSAAGSSGVHAAVNPVPADSFKYYSIESGSGRDAVGTVSGPGTLKFEDEPASDDASQVRVLTVQSRLELCSVMLMNAADQCSLLYSCASE